MQVTEERAHAVREALEKGRSKHSHSRTLLSVSMNGKTKYFVLRRRRAFLENGFSVCVPFYK
jgi:hypothetical protein